MGLARLSRVHRTLKLCRYPTARCSMQRTKGCLQIHGSRQRLAGDRLLLCGGEHRPANAGALAGNRACSNYPNLYCTWPGEAFSILLLLPPLTWETRAFGARLLADPPSDPPDTERLGRNMKVFLSWSGERSHAVAKVFNEWLPGVIQSVTPWLASEHIAKGASWLQEIKETIAASNGMGIFFLTAEAVNAPWMLFEAGGVAALEHKRVCTVLVGIDHGAVKPPLNIFQGTKLEKPDLLKLVRDMNARLPQPLSEPLLEKTFERAWPEFEAQLRSALDVADSPAEPSGSGNPVGPSFFAGDASSQMESSVEAVSQAVQGIEARLGRLEEESQKSNSQIVQHLGSLSALVQMAISRYGMFSPPASTPGPIFDIGNHRGLTSGPLASSSDAVRLAALGSDFGPSPAFPPAPPYGLSGPLTPTTGVSPPPIPLPARKSDKKKA